MYKNFSILRMPREPEEWSLFAAELIVDPQYLKMIIKYSHMFSIFGFLAVFVVSAAASAGCYAWPVRAGHDGRTAYDADTIRIVMPGLPPELAAVSVRIRGIDAPEIKGKCARERTAALAARDYVEDLVRSGRTFEFCDPEWEKYGRVLVSLRIDGRDVASALLKKGLARPYGGERRVGWCD